MRFRFLCILALAGLLLSPVTARAEPASSLAAVVTGVPGTVRIAAFEPDSIDPALSGDWTITNQLFSGLTRIDPVSKLPIGDLANSWTISPSGTEYTFTLRPALTWSNGTPLTATDVRYGILRSLNPANGSGTAYMLYPILNAYEYNHGTATQSQVGVTVLSPTQIKFTLTAPAAYFPANLAQAPARPQPAAAIRLWGSTWTEPGHIITSGPYKLTQWVHNDKMVLDKWTGFYGAASVKIPRVTVKITDETTAWVMFQNGALDTVNVPIANVPSVRSNPALSPLLHDAPSGCTQYYGFNTALAPFNDPLVRKVFIAAVNRPGLIDAQTGGTGVLAQTFTAPGMFGFVDGVAEGVGIPYDVTQARAWLSAAGFPNGAGLPPITLWFNSSPGVQAIAEYMQSNWAANLNVTVTLQSLPWSEYLNQLDQGTMQIWRLGWCLDYNDAYNFLYDAVVPSPGRYGGWSNSSYLSLLNDAALTTDDDNARRAFYKQAEGILVGTDAVMLPLFYNGSYVLTRPYLTRTYPLAMEMQIRDWALTFVSKTIISTAAQDGWTLELAENSNTGSSANATATTFRLGDKAGDKQYRSILSFNTSLLPPGAVISSVTLKIKSAGAPVGTNPFTTHGALTVDVKKGAFANSALLQAGDFQAAASKLAVTTMPKTPLSGWYSRALPATSFGYINRTGVTQFRLRFALDDNEDMSAPAASTAATS